MPTIRFGLAATLLLLFLVGCENARGERVTLQQWWRGRSGPNEQKAANGSPAADGERSDSPAATETASAAEEPSGQGLNGPASGSNHVATAPAAAPPSDAIRSDALVVNDEVITVREILDPILPRIKSLGRSLAPDLYYSRVLELVRQRLVDAVAQRLIYRRARQHINDQIEPRIKKAVERMERERINREFRGLETEYEKYLEKSHKRRADVHEQLRRSVVVDTYLRDRLLPMVPAPRKRELLKYYRAHLADYSKSQRRELYMIDVPIAAFLEPSKRRLADDLPLAEQKAHRAIEAAAAALRAGQPFEEVARKYSKGVHRTDGGAWGFISSPLAGRWKAAYQRFSELEAGQTSDIIEVDKSFFIVKVGKVEPAEVESFQSAQPGIVRILRNRRFQKLKADFLQKELDRSTIGSLDDFVRQVMRAVPEPGAIDPDQIPGTPSDR